MKLIRLLPLGLMMVGTGVGCGDVAAADTPQATAALAAPRAPRIEGFVQRTDIVSETGDQKDAHLLNAWGLVFSPEGLAWISSNGTASVVAYNEEGELQHEILSPAADKTTKERPAPTGLVWNPSPKAFGGEPLIFVTEGGTVASAATTDKEGTIQSFDPAAVYKGCAIATSRGHTRLYATDFVGGKVDVFDDNFQPLKMKGAFVDKALAKTNFAPFNVMAVGDKLIVTYAFRNGVDDQAGPGNGFVDLYDADGTFLARLISRGALNSPWGLALAPEPNERHSIDLMVGNFGDGTINVYDISFRGGRLDVDFEGPLGDKATGKPLVIEGLWSLVFGNGTDGFETDELYITAGPNDEADGLFAELAFIGRRR